MAEVRCAQCAESFEAQQWTRACPHCGAQKAGRCTDCGTAVDLPARTCNLHAGIAAAPFGGATTGAPPYEGPAWSPAAPVGDLLPAPRRRRRWPKALLGLAMLGAAGGGGFLAYTTITDKAYPDKWDPRVTDLVAFVERERGLEFDHPVSIDFLSDAEFRREATDHEDLTEEDKAEGERFEAMLRAVGFLQGDVDLEAIGEELIGDGTVGQYRFEDQRIAVRGETLDDERRSTLVHELTHALQDQNFKIGDYEAENSGGDLGFTAVVEADAESVAAAWEETLSDDAREALFEAQDETSSGADFEGVPGVFVELMGFPYAFGPRLLDAVISDKGLSGRNGLFTRPPVSEEQVILPEAYLAAQAVTKVATPKLAAGEKVIADSEGDFGMVSLLVVLAERVPYEVSWKAVQGWAGDSVIAFERGDDTCVRIDVAFDEAPQAERFEAAFDQWAKGYPAAHSREDRVVHLESCDPGTESPGRAEGQVSGIQGLSIRAEFMDQLKGVGVPDDKVGCVADGAIESLTANRIAELDRQLTESPTEKAVREVQSATQRSAVACGV